MDDYQISICNIKVSNGISIRFANTAIKTEISANALTKISTSDLEAGRFELYYLL
jgi:hypothetical protein